MLNDKSVVVISDDHQRQHDLVTVLTFIGERVHKYATFEDYQTHKYRHKHTTRAYIYSHKTTFVVLYKPKTTDQHLMAEQALNFFSGSVVTSAYTYRHII